MVAEVKPLYPFQSANGQGLFEHSLPVSPGKTEVKPITEVLLRSSSSIGATADQDSESPQLRQRQHEDSPKSTHTAELSGDIRSFHIDEIMFRIGIRKAHVHISCICFSIALFCAAQAGLPLALLDGNIKGRANMSNEAYDSLHFLVAPVAIIGAFLLPAAADIFGRYSTMKYSLLVSTGFSLLSGFTKNFPFYFFCYLVSASASAGLHSVAMIYLTESFSCRWRSLAVTIFFGFSVVGLVFIQAVAWFTSEDPPFVEASEEPWQFLGLCSSVPGVLSVLLLFLSAPGECPMHVASNSLSFKPVWKTLNTLIGEKDELRSILKLGTNEKLPIGVLASAAALSDEIEIATSLDLDSCSHVAEELKLGSVIRSDIIISPSARGRILLVNRYPSFVDRCLFIFSHVSNFCRLKYLQQTLVVLYSLSTLLSLAECLMRLTHLSLRGEASANAVPAPVTYALIQLPGLLIGWVMMTRVNPIFLSFSNLTGRDKGLVFTTATCLMCALMMSVAACLFKISDNHLSVFSYIFAVFMAPGFSNLYLHAMETFPSCHRGVGMAFMSLAVRIPTIFLLDASAFPVSWEFHFHWAKPGITTGILIMALSFVYLIPRDTAELPLRDMPKFLPKETIRKRSLERG